MSSGEESSGESAYLPSLADILKWKKKELEKWLQDRRLPKSAKKKEILAKRILSHMLGDDSDFEVDDDDDDEEDETMCHHVIPVWPGIK